MVGVAQLVEPRIVIPVVVGSSPIVHPNQCNVLADVVKLVDTPGLGPGAARCESSSLSVRTILNYLATPPLFIFL
jgi:hypothetical protein